MKHSADQILTALKQKVRVNKQHGYLEWACNGRGPAMRQGDPVVGAYIVVLGHRLQYTRAAWMLLTGQFLGPGDVLDTSLAPSDFKRWRVISKAAHGQALERARRAGLETPVYSSWVDYTGKVRRATKTQRSDYDTGWEKPYSEQRAAR